MTPRKKPLANPNLNRPLLLAVRRCRRPRLRPRLDAWTEKEAQSRGARCPSLPPFKSSDFGGRAATGILLWARATNSACAGCKFPKQFVMASWHPQQIELIAWPRGAAGKAAPRILLFTADATIQTPCPIVYTGCSWCASPAVVPCIVCVAPIALVLWGKYFGTVVVAWCCPVLSWESLLVAFSFWSPGALLVISCSSCSPDVMVFICWSLRWFPGPGLQSSSWVGVSCKCWEKTVGN